MNIKQRSFIVLASFCITAFVIPASHAFSITYDSDTESNVDFNKVPYTLGNRTGEAWVPEVLRLQRGGTPGLRRALRKAFPNWTFQIAPRRSGNYSLTGEFQINQYYACAILTPCGYPSTRSITGGVGALIDVSYIPGEGDPQFPDEVTWIQRVVSNHSAKSNRHNSKEDIVDNNDRTDNPFYFGSSNYSSYFFDRPYRGDPAHSHFWNGELYLVRRIGRNRVVIYDGIRWGWRNITRRRRNDDFCSNVSYSRATEGSITRSGTITYDCSPDDNHSGGGYNSVFDSLNFVTQQGSYLGDLQDSLPFTDDESIGGLEDFPLIETEDDLSTKELAEYNDGLISVPEPSTILGLLATVSFSGTLLTKKKG